jgi:mycoredoxin-dependent peroxiredoxin
MVLEVGSEAPDFTLRNQDFEKVQLSAQRGAPVLLVFYPFAFSRNCTGELCQLRDEFDGYRDAGVQVYGISVDQVHALKAWRRERDFDFALLADFWPHGQVARAYGVFNERFGFAERGTFLVDRDGTVRFTEQRGVEETRDQSGWKKAIAALSA